MKAFILAAMLPIVCSATPKEDYCLDESLVYQTAAMLRDAKLDQKQVFVFTGTYTKVPEPVRLEAVSKVFSDWAQYSPQSVRKIQYHACMGKAL